MSHMDIAYQIDHNELKACHNTTVLVYRS